MRLFPISGLILLASFAYAQVTFEVASIKPNRSADGNSSTSITNGRLSMRNVSLKRCILQAYDLKEYQLLVPDWLGTVAFDIEAKPPAATNNEGQFRQMLQALLADRFKLTVHRESKMLAAYELVAAKNGPKLQAAPNDGNSHTNSSRGHMTAQHVSMAELADKLARLVDKAVVDSTQLMGVYDFKLEWTPDSDDQKTDAAPGPSIFTALQEQLGLKLQPKKLPIEMLVVDHIERTPTEN
jgi:uncharacterized protein (TIGR03435 family)